MNIIKTNIPILYICYNRIDYVKQTLPLVLASSNKVYISSEGYNNYQEYVGVNKVRTYIKSLDNSNIILWERDKNYGCEQNIVDSLDWITGLEEEFIMIEEDVLLPKNNSFITFIEANRDKISDSEYSCISRVLYGANKQENYHFNPHGWYTKSSVFKSLFKDWKKFCKEEYLEDIIKYIYKPSKGSYKAIKNTLLNRPFYWDEFYKYSIYFNKSKVLYCPDNIGCTHIGKISSNQHGFIWLEDGTFKRIDN